MQAEDGAAEGGLAAAGLPHHAQGLALLQVKADVVHRVEHSAGGFEVLFQMLDFQNMFPPLFVPPFDVESRLFIGQASKLMGGR